MNDKSFKFIFKDYFKLSTGATAFVGLMEPSDYPLITTDSYVVKITSDTGKSYLFNKISEDIFARSNSSLNNNFRSLQTFENVDEYINEIKDHSVFICGYKR